MLWWCLVLGLSILVSGEYSEDSEGVVTWATNSSEYDSKELPTNITSDTHASPPEHPHHKSHKVQYGSAGFAVSLVLSACIIVLFIVCMCWMPDKEVVYRTVKPVTV